MFVSQERRPSKKTFQKPNILRRKAKDTAIRTSPCRPAPAVPGSSLPSVGAHKIGETSSSGDTAETCGVRCRVAPRLQLDVSAAPDTTLQLHQDTVQESALIHGTVHNSDQNVVNVEAFLNSSQSTQYEVQDETETKSDIHSPPKWQIDLWNADRLIVELEPHSALPTVLAGGALLVPLAAVATDGVPADTHVDADTHADADPETQPPQPTPQDPHTYKCPSCDKQFPSEQKLRRHSGVHGRAERQAAVECPARAPAAAGAGAPAPARCGKLFLRRAQLAAHLRHDHQPEDAPHRCGECGRRFFWATGLVAHARAHGRPAAAHGCAWPGCGRLFRQACRLREHARAHTGDRPYPCAHPGCGWAFRTASKLLRHARRHTGERRHACACGRAFRRREHLRQHQQRRAAPCRPPPASTAATAAAAAAATAAPSPQPARGEERAARTHCTWPLPRARRAAPPGAAADVTADADIDDAAHAEEVAEEVVAERALCAVRSDLFLPASAALNEDSQQMGAASPAEEGEEGGASPPHAGLGLLDLMQEELMYADAVDESSFQVLLLSDELR